MRTSICLHSVEKLLHGELEDPTQILGPRPVSIGGREALSVRAFLPDTEEAWVIQNHDQSGRPMRKIHPAGVYEAICPLPESSPIHDYQIRVAGGDGQMTTIRDPYSFAPLMKDLDLHLFGEGNHTRLYDKLGAQRRVVDGVPGVNFAVWAPNARGISVVGDFNNWDHRQHVMRKQIPSGVWELFVPELENGTRYKFRVKTQYGELIDKCDPFGFAAEVPPKTASIVTDLSDYQWSDNDWLEQRKNRDPLKTPMSVYEVHLGSWQTEPNNPNQWLNYRELAHRLVAYCKEMGFTHLELMPISEHPFTGSWGYQTVGYFAATSRYGTPQDFMYFVDYCHQNGIGVIIDWVPAHFPKDGHGLRRFDGTALYEHEDPRQGEHPDWGTLIFNYGRNEVRNFLVSNALFWLDHYHIDGLRVDAVASMLYLDYSREDGGWVPNKYGGRENLEAIDFLREFNTRVHSDFPGVVTVAEESTAWGGVSRPTYTGGLGFTFKWNMGWMNDTLRYMREDPIHRKYHHDELTFSLIYAFTENFVLPFSHDEVVHGKGALLDQMPGDYWQRFANLRILYSYMWTHPGRKLLFMGSEFGQWNEWDHNKSLDWLLLDFESHRGIKKLVADLNKLYLENPSLYELDFESAGFEWIDAMNHADSILSYVRKGQDPNEQLIVTLNLTPVVREGYRLGVPKPGYYAECFNSDSEHYGGSNVGNYPGAESQAIGAQGREHSIEITLPPLGCLIFKNQSNA